MIPLSFQRTRYSLARLLRKAANRIASKGTVSGVSYANIGTEQLPNNAPRALILYSVTGIDRYVRGLWPTDPIFNKHTIYWESGEMVRLLNEQGYIVDFCDVWKPVTVDWNRYALIIDNLDHLKDVPENSAAKKVFWATNNHWLTWNAGELQRIQWFKERTGILVPANRQLPSFSSDQCADYLTYFGTQLQIDSFDKKPTRKLINISSCSIPPYQKKNMATARKKFLWISGGGFLHKGLNVAIEAFQKIPEAELYIVADLKDPHEPQLQQWAGPILARYPHIYAMGWFDLTSPEFNALADACIGVLYLSSSCGGPGSTARVLHNGLIPIVTPTGFVRAETLGYQVIGENVQELIDNTIERVREVMALSDTELRERSNAVREFAQANHTREAFSASFSDFIQHI